eukprot:GEMP01006789.1.p1 GENE.GEMP01006789.1~~GEMP01006789.1.p1  ORF type:complete len:934 (+),score=191.46 GEMP01006789.1:87-2804(+)
MVDARPKGKALAAQRTLREAKLQEAGAMIPSLSPRREDDDWGTLGNVQAFSLEWPPRTPENPAPTGSVYTVFALLALSVALVNFDSGAIPAIVQKFSKGCLLHVRVPPLTADEAAAFVDALVGTTIEDRLSWFLKTEIDLSLWGKVAMRKDPRAYFDGTAADKVLLTTDRLLFDYPYSPLRDFPPFLALFTERPPFPSAPHRNSSTDQPPHAVPHRLLVDSPLYGTNDSIMVDLDAVTCLASDDPAKCGGGQFLSFRRGCLMWRPRVSFVDGAFPQWNFLLHVDEEDGHKATFMQTAAACSSKAASRAAQREAESQNSKNHWYHPLISNNGQSYVPHAPIPLTVAALDSPRALTGDAWDSQFPLCVVDIAPPIGRHATLVPMIHVDRKALSDAMMGTVGTESTMGASNNSTDNSAPALAAPVLLLRADTEYVYGDERLYPCLNDSDVGILGAMPFVGVCVACIVIAHLQRRGKWVGTQNKHHLVLGILGSIVTLCGFLWTHVKEYLWLVRFLNGVAQCPVITLAPVWVAHFGRRRQTQWMGIMQGASAMGTMLGYAVCGAMLANNVHYTWAFALQVALLSVLCLVVVLLTPAKYLNIESHAPTVIDRHGSDLSLLSHIPASSTVLDGSSRWRLGGLFWHTSFITCWVFFCVTGLQLWATKYFMFAFLRTVGDVTTHFILICITAPTFGLFVGSRARFNFSSPHGLQRALDYMAFLSAVALCAGVLCLLCPFPWDALRLGCTPHYIELAYTTCAFAVTNKNDGLAGADCAFANRCAQLVQDNDVDDHNSAGGYHVHGYMGALSALWCVLCSGAAILPVCSSMQLNVVKESLRPTAAAVNLFVTHLVGYALGAWLPGYVSEYVDGAVWQRVRAAMIIVFLMPSMGLLNILAACVLIRRKYREFAPEI